MKTDDKLRLVVDYSQTVNRFCDLDAYPLPNMDDLARNISRFKYYSKLDLKAAYHQIPLHDADKSLTAFQADGRLFQYTRLPFGVTNAVSAFQRVMDELISSHNLSGTYAYLDDVIVVGKTIEEHDENLRRLFSVTTGLHVTLNKDKCLFRQTSICYLGYQIELNSIRPDPNRLKPLVDYPLPNTAKQLQRLIGLLSYYSKWVSSYSKLIQPLLNATIPLGPDAIESVKQMKVLITKSSLIPLLPDVPLHVETDASDSTLSGVLFQCKKPVAFFSRTLSKSERNLSSIEKEAMAVVESVRKWRTNRGNARYY